MDRIPSPPADGHPDSFLRCQEATDDVMAAVALAAVDAGWTPEEVAAALVELANNLMLSVLANRDLDRNLAGLRSGRAQGHVRQVHVEHEWRVFAKTTGNVSWAG